MFLGAGAVDRVIDTLTRHTAYRRVWGQGFTFEPPLGLAPESDLFGTRVQSNQQAMALSKVLKVRRLASLGVSQSGATTQLN